MALNLKYLNLKRVIEKKNYFGYSKRVTDLTEPTLKPNYSNPNFVVARTILINEDYAMRPDLISMFAYGTDVYTDIILKFNGISNPFSIAVGDLLFIPKLSGAKTMYIQPKPTKKEIEEVKRSYIDKSRYSKPTEERLAKLKALAEGRKNGSPTIEPSGKLKPGESAVTTKAGALIFASYRSKDSKKNTDTNNNNS